MSFPHTRKRLRIAAIVGGVAASLALAGCSSAGSAPSDTASDGPQLLTTINVANVPQQQNIQEAIDNGFFAKRGLKVNLQNIATGSQILAAIQGGSIDIGYADVYAGLNAIKNGYDVRFVAANNGPAASTPFVVKSDSSVKSASDLVGKSLGLGGVPQYGVYAWGFLQHNGVTDPSKVKFVTIQQALAIPDALQNGSIDAAEITWAQFYSNQGQAGAYNFRLLGDPSNASFAPSTAVTAGFWSTASWAGAHPKEAQAFADALRDFNTWYDALSLDQLNQLSVQYAKTDLKQLSNGDQVALERLVKSGYNVKGEWDLTATQQWIDLGAKALPAQIPGDVDFGKYVLSTADAVNPPKSGSSPTPAK